MGGVRGEGLSPSLPVVSAAWARGCGKGQRVEDTLLAVFFNEVAPIQLPDMQILQRDGFSLSLAARPLARCTCCTCMCISARPLAARPLAARPLAVCLSLSLAAHVWASLLALSLSLAVHSRLLSSAVGGGHAVAWSADARPRHCVVGASLQAASALRQSAPRPVRLVSFRRRDRSSTCPIFFSVNIFFGEQFRFVKKSNVPAGVSWSSIIYRDSRSPKKTTRKIVSSILLHIYGEEESI